MSSLGKNSQSQFSSFNDFLNQVNLAPTAAEKDQLIQSYLSQQRNAVNIPITEQENCTFIYYGVALTVQVAGDFNGWSGEDLQKISDTNLWYITKEFPRDARLDYKLIVDGNWILDPENDRLIMGGYGPNSELLMPDYKMDPAIIKYEYVPSGTIETINDFTSTYRNNKRTIEVYLPPDYDESKQYPSFYVMDGLEYIDLANFDNVLDYLIFNGLIQEIIVVFVPPVDRGVEYYENLDFLSLLTKELIPLIDSTYSTIPNRTERGMMGASLGGFISIAAGFYEESSFGQIASQSGYFESSMIGKYSIGQLDIKFYLDVGTFETSISSTDLLAINRQMNQTMDQVGNTYFYQEVPEGHSWGNWRAHLDDILTYFFPGDGVSKNTTTLATTLPATTTVPTTTTTTTTTSPTTTSVNTTFQTSTTTIKPTTTKSSINDTDTSTTTQTSSDITPISLLGVSLGILTLLKRKLRKS
ncbi:MAG: hypothetical protein JSV04_00840 [Candidatus Heimdallarchaeota archaeon]|nr:MAG: hypothetical protein JSV04_00840 [Candidatus Heimdallarchaeota archaeon]